jgi:hypothetical protein
MFCDVRLDFDQIVSITLAEEDGLEAVKVSVVQRGVPGSYVIKPSAYLSTAPGLFIDAAKNLLAAWCAYKLNTNRLASLKPQANTAEHENLARLNNRVAVLERNYATLRDVLANLKLSAND